jgi:hypothetical protein
VAAIPHLPESEIKISYLDIKNMQFFFSCYKNLSFLIFFLFVILRLSGKLMFVSIKHGDIIIFQKKT